MQCLCSLVHVGGCEQEDQDREEVDAVQVHVKVRDAASEVSKVSRCEEQLEGDDAGNTSRRVRKVEHRVQPALRVTQLPQQESKHPLADQHVVHSVPSRQPYACRLSVNLLANTGRLHQVHNHQVETQRAHEQQRFPQVTHPPDLLASRHRKKLQWSGKRHNPPRLGHHSLSPQPQLQLLRHAVVHRGRPAERHRRRPLVVPLHVAGENLVAVLIEAVAHVRQRVEALPQVRRRKRRRKAGARQRQLHGALLGTRQLLVRRDHRVRVEDLHRQRLLQALRARRSCTRQLQPDHLNLVRRVRGNGRELHQQLRVRHPHHPVHPPRQDVAQHRSLPPAAHPAVAGDGANQHRCAGLGEHVVRPRVAAQDERHVVSRLAQRVGADDVAAHLQGGVADHGLPARPHHPRRRARVHEQACRVVQQQRLVARDLVHLGAHRLDTQRAPLRVVRLHRRVVEQRLAQHRLPPLGQGRCRAARGRHEVLRAQLRALREAAAGGLHVQVRAATLEVALVDRPPHRERRRRVRDRQLRRPHAALQPVRGHLGQPADVRQARVHVHVLGRADRVPRVRRKPEAHLLTLHRDGVLRHDRRTPRVPPVPSARAAARQLAADGGQQRRAHRGVRRRALPQLRHVRVLVRHGHRTAVRVDLRLRRRREAVPPQRELQRPHCELRRDGAVRAAERHDGLARRDDVRRQQRRRHVHVAHYDRLRRAALQRQVRRVEAQAERLCVLRVHLGRHEGVLQRRAQRGHQSLDVDRRRRPPPLEPGARRQRKRRTGEQRALRLDGDADDVGLQRRHLEGEGRRGARRPLRGLDREAKDGRRPRTQPRERDRPRLVVVRDAPPRLDAPALRPRRELRLCVPRERQPVEVHHRLRQPQALCAERPRQHVAHRHDRHLVRHAVQRQAPQDPVLARREVGQRRRRRTLPLHHPQPGRLLRHDPLRDEPGRRVRRQRRRLDLGLLVADGVSRRRRARAPRRDRRRTGTGEGLDVGRDGAAQPRRTLLQLRHRHRRRREVGEGGPAALLRRPRGFGSQRQRRVRHGDVDGRTDDVQVHAAVVCVLV
eukprot:Rhum_TRINITY_DN15351_c4_g1::Rhum_TRINITY_DN15351_c4_g1_i1::g.152352::m.152352